MTAVRLPRISPPPGHEGPADAGTYISGLLPEYAARLGAFGSAVMRQEGLGPRLLELARLRNAALMHCRLCLNLRRQSAIDDGLEETTVSQLSSRELDGISARERTVIDLVDAFVSAPGRLPPELVTRVQRELTPSEQTQLLLSMAVWTGNRVLVALGLDAPVETDRLTAFEYLQNGVQQYGGDLGRPPHTEGPDHG